MFQKIKINKNFTNTIDTLPVSSYLVLKFESRKYFPISKCSTFKSNTSIEPKTKCAQWCPNLCIENETDENKVVSKFNYE